MTQNEHNCNRQIINQYFVYCNIYLLNIYKIIPIDEQDRFDKRDGNTYTSGSIAGAETT